MTTRWYNAAVVVLWLATMSWLISEKVLPPLRVGDRPDFDSVLNDPDSAARLPVAWELFWGERSMGWASNHTVKRPDGLTELQSRVRVAEFPLEELPRWLAPQLEFLEGPQGLRVDIETRIQLSPGGRLHRIRSNVGLGELDDVLRLRGVAKGHQLELTLRIGEFSYTTLTNLAADALVGDGISPRAVLPELHVGQTWTEPVYNPLNGPNRPMQILHAKVERREPIVWNGEVVSTWLIVYRNDPGSERIASQAPRGQAWVRRDGTVLQQEVLLFGSRLMFVRLPPGQFPAALVDAADEPAGFEPTAEGPPNEHE